MKPKHFSLAVMYLLVTLPFLSLAQAQNIAMPQFNYDNSVGLVDRIANIKFNSEYYILEYIYAKKLSQKDSDSKKNQLKPEAYKDPKILEYLSLKIQTDRILLQLITDLSRNKMKFFRKIDNSYGRHASWSIHGFLNTKKTYYANRYENLNKAFISFVNIQEATPEKKLIGIQMMSLEAAADGGNNGNNGGNNSSSGGTDYSSIFSTLYGVYKDILANKVSTEGRIIVILNALRLSTPDDLLNDVTSQFLQAGGNSGGGGSGGNNGDSGNGNDPGGDGGSGGGKKKGN